MAIYHCSVKVGSRSNGASAVGSCAYREGKKMEEDRLGIVHDYSRKSGVVDSFTLAPENAPDWARSSATLWNEVENVEKRKDAQVFREVVVALPREFDQEQQRSLVSHYVQRHFVDEGMCATVAMHETQRGNPHAHIMLTTRDISENGFGLKQRDWNQRERLQLWRSEWSESVNQALQREGFDQQIDHRTLDEQGISREPHVHMGKVATAMERRGQESIRGDLNRHIDMANRQASDLGERFLQQHLAHAREAFEAHQQMEKQEQKLRSERERQIQMERHEKTLSSELDRERSRGFER